MNSLLLALHLLITVSASAATVVICADSEKSTELTARFAKSDKNSGLSRLTLKSGGKSKDVEAKNILRYIRNATEFYILFKIQSKSGLLQVELNTRFVKNPRGTLGISSAGYLANKSQPPDKLPVICRF